MAYANNVAAAQAAAQRINALLASSGATQQPIMQTSPNAQTPVVHQAAVDIALAAANAQAAAARINQMLMQQSLQVSSSQMHPLLLQQQFRPPLFPDMSASMGAFPWTPNFQMAPAPKKVGIISTREAEGAAFGLHRDSFRAQGTELKVIKLLIGIEVSIANMVGFPLVEQLTGPGNCKMLDLMKTCPGALIALHGQGSPLGGDDALHFRISGSKQEALDAAQTRADKLVGEAHAEYHRHREQLSARQQAAGSAGAIAVWRDPYSANSLCNMSATPPTPTPLSHTSATPAISPQPYDSPAPAFGSAASPVWPPLSSFQADPTTSLGAGSCAPAAASNSAVSQPTSTSSLSTSSASVGSNAYSNHSTSVLPKPFPPNPITTTSNNDNNTGNSIREAPVKQPPVPGTRDGEGFWVPLLPARLAGGLHRINLHATPAPNTFTKHTAENNSPRSVSTTITHTSSPPSSTTITSTTTASSVTPPPLPKSALRLAPAGTAGAQATSAISAIDSTAPKSGSVAGISPVTFELTFCLCAR